MAKSIRIARSPIRPLRGRWPDVVEKRAERWFWSDPSVVCTPEPTEEQFQEAMKAFAMGDTIKITASNRHPALDDLLVDHVDVSGADILDVGVSDGSTSVDLIERLGDFASYTLTDLHLSAQVQRVGRRRAFLQGDGECFMIVGPRVIAWPRSSRSVRSLYRRTLGRIGESSTDEVLLLGPRARRVLREDPRVRMAVHNVFEPWPSGPVDVVKVANLLRFDYFPEDRLSQAFTAIHASLNDGGHLLVANNVRSKDGPAGGLFRRDGDRFVSVATAGSALDVAPVVLGVGSRRA